MVRIIQLLLLWLIWPGILFAQAVSTPAPAVTMVKFYPLSLLRGEARFGLEKQKASGKGWELGAGYLFRAYEPTSVVSYSLPYAMDKFPAKGLAMRAGISHINTRKPDQGLYTNVSLLFRYIRVKSTGEGPGSDFDFQGHLGIQAIAGPQFTSCNLRTVLFGGLGFYHYWRHYRSPYLTQSDYSTGISPQVLLGLSVGFSNAE